MNTNTARTPDTTVKSLRVISANGSTYLIANGDSFESQWLIKPGQTPAQAIQDAIDEQCRIIRDANIRIARLHSADVIRFSREPRESESSLEVDLKYDREVYGDKWHTPMSL